MNLYKFTALIYDDHDILMNSLVLFYFCQYIRYSCLEENRRYHLKAVRVETNNLFSTVINFYLKKMLFNYFERIDFIANEMINIRNYLYRIFFDEISSSLRYAI